MDSSRFASVKRDNAYYLGIGDLCDRMLLVREFVRDVLPGEIVTFTQEWYRI